jgi:hypothetical protein
LSSTRPRPKPPDLRGPRIAEGLSQLRLDQAPDDLVLPRRNRSPILAITDQACAACLDDEYAELSRRLVARLARKRPSPLARGEARIWAAGAIYAIGQLNLLFDRSQKPHLSANELIAQLAVVKSSMANKGALIRKTLDRGVYEPDLTRRSMLERHPLTWLVQVNGLLADARILPAELQDEARRRGLIPDLDERRAA